MKKARYNSKFKRKKARCKRAFFVLINFKRLFRLYISYFFPCRKKYGKKGTQRDTLCVLPRRKSCDVSSFVRNLRFVHHRRFADLLRRWNQLSVRSSRFSLQKVQQSNTKADFSAQKFFTRVFMGFLQKHIFSLSPHSFIKRVWLFDGQFLKSCPFDDKEYGCNPNVFFFRESP